MGGVLKNVKKQKVKKVDIAVVRLTRAGSLANGRPCRKCLEIMQKLEVRKVFYSTGNGNEMKMELVKDMISIQDSSSSKHFEKIKRGITDQFTDQNYYKFLMEKHLPLEVKKESMLNFIKYFFKEWIKTLNFNLNYRFTKNNKKLYFEIFEILSKKNTQERLFLKILII